MINLCLIVLMCGVADTPSNQERVEKIAISQGWRHEQLPDLMCLIKSESDFNQNAIHVNGGDYEPDYGLTQISGNWGTGFPRSNGETWPPHNEEWTGEYLLDPANNLRAALEIWQRSGFRQWHGYAKRCDL
jgi:hypothetical protein